MGVQFCFFPKRRKQGPCNWVGIFWSCHTGAIAQHYRVKATNYLKTRNSSGCSEGAGFVESGSSCLIIEANLHAALRILYLLYFAGGGTFPVVLSPLHIFVR